MSNELKGMLFAAGATVCWSLSGVVVRFVPEIDPWTFNAYRGGSMSVALLLWMVLRYRGGVARHFRFAEPGAIAVVACCFAIGSSLYIAAISLASVAAVSCVGATSPLFAALLARIWLGERTPMIIYVAIGVAFIGVAIVALGESGASLTGFSGSLVAVVVALCFASQMVALRRYHSVEMAPALVIGGALVFCVVSFTVGRAPVTLLQFLLLAGTGVIQLAVPLVLYMHGSRYAPAVQMILVSLADAFLNPFWVWLVHGEKPGLPTFWGGILIVGAIAIAIAVPRRQSATT